jgi:hypothetical protein
MIEMMRCSHHLILTVVLCVGCGSVKSNQLPDAPPAIDASARGTVHVTVLDGGGSGAPAVGANVVFIDPDGTLVKRVATDTAGKADADVLPGASVTSIALLNMTYQLQTVTAVKPGDDLVLGSKNTDFTAAGTFTVNYPAATGAVSYVVGHACGPTFVNAPVGAPPPTTATLTMTNNCKQSKMEIVVVPMDASNAPLGSISQSDVTFTSGGSVTLNGQYQSARAFTASYTNIPSSVTALLVSRSVPDGFGVQTSLSMASPTASQVMNLSGGSATAARVASRFSVSSTRAFQEIRQNLSGTAATYGFDASTNLLPWITQVSFDAATHKLATTIDTAGTSGDQPDMFRVFATYRRTDPNSQVTTTYSWSVFAPQAGDVTLPTLPPEVGDVAPTATDTLTLNAIMLEGDTISGYDAIRNNLNDAITVYGSGRPPAGTIRLSAWPIALRGSPTSAAAE